MNIISFSLYGNEPRYFIGAEKNLELAKAVYPCWVCRYYVDNTVPQDSVQRLIAGGAQVVDMSGSEIRCKMLWRYLVQDDPDVAVWVSRDTDSRFNAREKSAVDQWLISGKKAHIMRDHPAHDIQILGGMFGAKGKVVDNMQDLILGANCEDEYGADQVFLEKYVYPKVKRSVTIHDDMARWRAYIVGAENMPQARVGWHFVGEIYDENDCFNQKDQQVLAGYYANEKNSHLIKFKRDLIGCVRRGKLGDSTIQWMRKIKRWLESWMKRNRN